MRKMDLEIDSSTDKKIRRFALKCSICRPHRGENKTYTKRGQNKDLKTRERRKHGKS